MLTGDACSEPIGLKVAAAGQKRETLRRAHHSQFVMQSSCSVVQLARHPSSSQLPTQVVFVSSQLFVHVVVVVVVELLLLLACALLPAWPFESSLALHIFTQSSCCVVQVPRQPSSSHLPEHDV
jgi:hypothetical protein